MDEKWNMSWLALCWVSLVKLVFAADEECFSPLSCQGTVVKTNNDIYGWGYQSIYGASTTINTTDTLFCRGGESCSHVKLAFSENNLECDGAAACAFASLLKIDDTAYCRGSNACSFTTIKAIDFNKELWCEGGFSCSHTYIHTTDTIIAYGSFALYESYIDSINSDNMFIDLRGAFTGLGATILCRNGDTMTVECRGNGCYNLTLISENSCDLTVNCDDSDSQFCPNVVRMDPTNYYFSLIETRLNDILSLVNENTTFSINENDCDGASSVTYDDYQEQLGANLISTSENALCCRGGESCYQASEIRTESNNGTIVCSARESCFDVPLIITGQSLTYLTGNGNIYCLAHTACRQSILYAGNEGGMIICNGKRACRDSIILSAKYLFCMATIECCNGAMIKNVENVYFLSGPDQANDNARIVSNNLNGNVMNVYMVSKAAGDDVHIFCNSTDSCYIECLTNGACENTNLTCDGTCTIYCNLNRNIDCPTILGSSSGTIIYIEEPTRQPTAMPSIEPVPTEMPIIMPSGVPTHTRAPTNVPVINPTSMPTFVPQSTARPRGEETTTSTLSVSTVSSTQSDGGVEIESTSKYGSLLSSYDSIGMYAIYITLCAMLFLVGLSYIYHECILKCCYPGYNGSDAVQYIAILKFCQNTVDFWTDLFFVFVLYLQGLWPLWGYALIFVFIPYIVSCITAVVCTVRWRHWNMDHPTRLHGYLSKYEFFIYFLTIVAGFYSALDLTRSKLFYKKYYYFPLKRDEYNNIKHWRFINIVLLENIPQFCIQLVYLLDDSEDTSPIVFVSLAFTILSLTLAFMQEISRICAPLQVSKKKFSHVTDIKGNLKIASKELKFPHLFAHRRIESCIEAVLDTSQDNQLWKDRSDVLYFIEVYHIQDRIYVMHEIDVYFEIKMYHSGDDKSRSQAIYRNIEQMSKKGSRNQKKLITALATCLKIEKEDGIEVEHVTPTGGASDDDRRTSMTTSQNQEYEMEGQVRDRHNTGASETGGNDDVDEDLWGYHESRGKPPKRTNHRKKKGKRTKDIETGRDRGDTFNNDAAIAQAMQDQYNQQLGLKMTVVSNSMSKNDMHTTAGSTTSGGGGDDAYDTPQTPGTPPGGDGIYQKGDKKTPQSPRNERRSLIMMTSTNDGKKKPWVR